MGDFETELVACMELLKGFALRFERDADRANDLLQETLLAAIEHQGSFRGESSLITWLFSIMKHKSLSAYRARRRFAYGQAYDEALVRLLEEPSQLDHVLVRQMSECLDALAPIHKEALLGVRVMGYSIGELAHKAKVPEGTIKSRIHYANKALSKRPA